MTTRTKARATAKPAAGVGYAALLRGVSPMNATMPALRRCFVAAGFTDVKTVLASGNLVFRAPRASLSTIAARVAAAMDEHLARPFPVIVRTIAELAAMLASAPWHLRPVAARSGLHGSPREDVWQGHHDADLGDLEKIVRAAAG